MKKIINCELDNIIQDLNQYILIKLTKPESEKDIFENPVRFSYI